MLRRMTAVPAAAAVCSAMRAAGEQVPTSNLGNVIHSEKVKLDTTDELVANAIEKAMKKKEKKKPTLRLIKDYKLGKKSREEEAARRAAHKPTPNPHTLAGKGTSVPESSQRSERYMHVETPITGDGMPFDGRMTNGELEPRFFSMGINC